MRFLTSWLRNAPRSLRDLLADRRGNGLGVSTDTAGRHLYFFWQDDPGDIWVMDVLADESE